MKYFYIIFLVALIAIGYALFANDSEKPSTETAYYVESITQTDAQYRVLMRAVEFDWECSSPQCPNGYSKTDLQQKDTLDVSDKANITFVSDSFYEVVRLGIMELDEDDPDFQPTGTMNFYEFAVALQDNDVRIEDTIINSLPFRIKTSGDSVTEFNQIYLP